MPGRRSRARGLPARIAVAVTVAAATLAIATSPGVTSGALAHEEGVHAAGPLPTLPTIKPYYALEQVCLVCSDPPVAIAGAATQIRVTAKTLLGTTDTKYTGIIKFKSTDAQATIPAPYHFTLADKGWHVFSFTFRHVPSDPSHLQTIVAEEVGDPTMEGSLKVEVQPTFASHLVFATDPAGAVAGTPFATQPAVQTLDEFYNPAPFLGDIGLSLVSPPGVAATLTCTGPATPDQATFIQTFSGCSIDHAGTAFRLLASIIGGVLVTSHAFDVAAPASSPSPSGSPSPSPSPSPSGSPSPSPSPSSALALSASASTVAYPDEVTFSTTLAGAGAGRLILIERRDAGTATWVATGTTTTDGTGHGTLEYLPVRTAEYRAVWPGAQDLAAAMSAAATVAVKFQVIVSPAAKTRTANAGKTLTWTATVRPQTKGVTVRFRLYRVVDGAWVVAATTPATTNAQGKAVYTRKFPSKGRWSLVITALAGPANDAGTAPRKYVTVK